MSQQCQVYLLDPKKLPPETIAVTFAKTSRSPESFAEIAAELTDETSSQFHEKWVVGYGHSSVAEHAILHIAIENISRLAVEPLESNRLASYTEKSTRYQKWEQQNYHIPAELEKQPTLLSKYKNTCDLLFKTYLDSVLQSKPIIQKQFPRKDNESETVWDSRIRSKYIDACRFLLPASSLANVGVTINARSLEHCLRKMFSHPLQEVNHLANQIKIIAQQTAPTLIKYIEPDSYLLQVNHSFSQIANNINTPKDNSQIYDWCTLINYNPDGENQILAANLYKHSNQTYTSLLNYTRNLPNQQKLDLAKVIFSGISKHTIPVRELEYYNFTFDLLLDQGAYFELKRHRMMTQTPQPLTSAQGYTTPKLLVEAGLSNQYKAAMETASECFENISAFNPAVASYIIPNGYNRRVLLNLNLRTLIHFINLRTAPNAHFSIRRIAQKMLEEVKKCSPIFAEYINPAITESWQSIETQYFD